MGEMKIGLAVAAVLVLGIASSWAIRSLIFVGDTIVEREVFEQSYQYTAGQRERIATFEAQLAEINAQLLRPDLPAGTRADYEAQAALIRVQLDEAQRVRP